MAEEIPKLEHVTAAKTELKQLLHKYVRDYLSGGGDTSKMLAGIDNVLERLGAHAHQI